MGWVQDPHIQELLLKQTDNARASAQEKAKMDQLELDAVTPLYEGCRPEDTRLKVTLMALEIKVKHKMTDACFDENMSFWHERLPKGNKFRGGEENRVSSGFTAREIPCVHEQLHHLSGRARGVYHMSGVRCHSIQEEEESSSKSGVVLSDHSSSAAVFRGP